MPSDVSYSPWTQSDPSWPRLKPWREVGETQIGHQEVCIIHDVVPVKCVEGVGIVLKEMRTCLSPLIYLAYPSPALSHICQPIWLFNNT